MTSANAVSGNALIGNVVLFGRALRRAGLSVDADQTRRFADVLALLGFDRRGARGGGDARGAQAAIAPATVAPAPSRTSWGAPRRPPDAPTVPRRGRRSRRLPLLATPCPETPHRVDMRHLRLDGAL